MSMTYRELQDAVIDRCCSSSQRASVKNAILFRHAWLWDLESWTFRYGTNTGITFTAGSQVVSNLPDDFHAVEALYDGSGCPIRAIHDRREFLDYANANSNPGVGSPSFYTVIGGQILTDTQGDGTTGLLAYEKAKPALVNDNDTTGLPDGYDLALIHGGKAEMFKLQIVPDLAISFDADFTAAANALRNSYLTEVKEAGQQFGAYSPGW